MVVIQGWCLGLTVQFCRGKEACNIHAEKDLGPRCGCGGPRSKAQSIWCIPGGTL